MGFHSLKCCKLIISRSEAQHRVNLVLRTGDRVGEGPDAGRFYRSWKGEPVGGKGVSTEEPLTFTSCCRVAFGDWPGADASCYMHAEGMQQCRCNVEPCLWIEAAPGPAISSQACSTGLLVLIVRGSLQFALLLCDMRYVHQPGNKGFLQHFYQWPWKEPAHYYLSKTVLL